MEASNKLIILNVIQETGKKFLADFRKTPIPEDFEKFMSALNAIETESFDALKAGINAIYIDIPWVDDDEFDAQSQKKPNTLPRYWICDTMDGAIQ